jgi:hypothetical protein
VRDAERVEEAAHHRTLMREVIGHKEPGGQHLGDDGHAGDILRLLLHRHGDHALEAELDPLRDQADRFRLLVRGIVVAPEGFGGLQLAFGAQLFPES